MFSADDLIGLKYLKESNDLLSIFTQYLISLGEENFNHEFTTITTSPSRNFCSTVFRIGFFVGSLILSSANHTFIAIHSS